MTNKTHIPKWILEGLNVKIKNDKVDEEYKIFIPEIMLIACLDVPEKLGDRIISSVRGRISSEVHPNMSFYVRQHSNINAKMCEIVTEEFINLANDEMNTVLGTAILVGYQITFAHGSDFPIFGKGTLTSIKYSHNEGDQSKKEMGEMDESISADMDKAYNNLLLKTADQLVTTNAVDSWSCSKLKTASDVVSEMKLKLFQEEEEKNKYSQFCMPCGRDDIRITETDMEYHIHIPEKIIAGPTYPVIHVENLDYMLGSVLRSNINTFFPIRHEHIRFTTSYNDTKNGNIIEAPLFRIKTHDVLGYFGYDVNPQPYDKHNVGVLGSLIRREYNNLYSSIRTVDIHDIDSSDLDVKWIQLTENLVITVGDDILTNAELQHFGDYLWRNVPLDHMGKYHEVELNVEDSSENTLVSWKMPTDVFKEIIESDGRNQEIRRLVLEHIKRGQ